MPPLIRISSSVMGTNRRRKHVHGPVRGLTILSTHQHASPYHPSVFRFNRCTGIEMSSPFNAFRKSRSRSPFNAYNAQEKARPSHAEAWATSKLRPAEKAMPKRRPKPMACMRGCEPDELVWFRCCICLEPVQAPANSPPTGCITGCTLFGRW